MTKLASIYDSLLLGYLDDVTKYAKSTKQVNILRHVISQAPNFAGERIKFEGFGRSNYGSREVGEALRVLEKAMLVRLVYPTNEFSPPFQANFKRSPKLQFVDTGLVNFICGLQSQFFSLADLNSVHKGKIAEHIIGQLLLTQKRSSLDPLIFWTRKKLQSNAEIDFVLPYESMLIPIEVKSGKVGSLRSLHSFMDQVEHDVAIRFYAGEFYVDKVETPQGKSFRLVNVPHYLCGSIHAIISSVFDSFDSNTTHI